MSWEQVFLSWSTGDIREWVTAGSVTLPKKTAERAVESRGGHVGWGGMCSCTVCGHMRPASVCVDGSAAYISFSKGHDPKGLRITGVDSMSNEQNDFSLSERSKLAPYALAYQQLKEGCTRPDPLRHTGHECSQHIVPDTAQRGCGTSGRDQRFPVPICLSQGITAGRSKNSLDSQAGTRDSTSVCWQSAHLPLPRWAQVSWWGLPQAWPHSSCYYVLCCLPQ